MVIPYPNELCFVCLFYEVFPHLEVIINPVNEVLSDKQVSEGIHEFFQKLERYILDEIELLIELYIDMLISFS
jgi:hypothetical protein